jgi:predicted transcriptional regulator
LLRLTPSSGVARLEPGSHAHRFLEAVDAHPGLMSGTIEALLNLRPDVVSRIGRRLRDEELVHQRRAGRHKHWDITPRGRQVLAAASRAQEPADDAPSRRGDSADSA